MPNGQAQTYSVDEFAQKIKARNPSLEKFDNRELVSGVIQRQPKLQRFLSTESLKNIAAGDKLYPSEGGLGPVASSFDIEHEAKTAMGIPQAVGQFLQTIFDPRIPVTGKHGMIQKLTEPYAQEVQKAHQLWKQGNRVEAAGHELASYIPIFGPMASEFADRVGKRDIGGALTEAAIYALLGKGAKDLDKDSLAKGYASVVKNSRLQALIQNSAYEDNFVNAKGLDIRDKVASAQRAAQDEVNKHAQAVASVVDKRNPGGVIDANAEALNLSNEFKQLVKTPAAQTPWLQKILKHAPETHPGGLWTFEEARQFRSDVGDALRNSHGVGTAVLARVYHSLTEKLAQTAKDYGMEDSWNHYNKLKATMSQNFGDILDDITSSKSGQEVAKALLKDKGLSSELVRNLSKYGLDPKDVMRFRKYAASALRSGVYRSVFRYIYGTPAGFVGYMGAKMAGLPWVPSFGVGAAIGITTSKLLALARMARVDPAIMDEVFSKREMPGPRGVSEPPQPPGQEPPISGLPATIPPGGLRAKSPIITPKGPIFSGPSSLEDQGPQEPHLPMPPGALGPVPSALPEAKPEPPKPEPQAPETPQDVKAQLAEAAKDLDLTKAKDRQELARKAKELIKKSKPETRYSKLSGGQKLAEQRKAVDRITKSREIARRARQKEIEEASGAPVEKGASAIQIPELEEALQEHSPEDLETLKGLRKKGKINDEQYVEGLKAFLLMALDKKGE